MMARVSTCLLVALLVLAVCLMDVQCDTRNKRSDDHPAFEAVVSGLSQQVTRLGAQLTAIQNQMGTQITSLQTQTETKMTALQNQLNHLQTKFAWSRDKRSDDHNPLEAVVSGLSQQVTRLGAQLTAIQNQMGAQITSLQTQTETKMTALQNQLNHLQTKFDASQKQVAFVARNSADPFNVAAAGTLVYNVADINLGGGFDTVTGVFTAPTSGLYVFFLNCMAVSGGVDEDIGVLVD
ncbi:uncharacterized protein, partial [Littorina saxatilis]|uniref:uncharacterized protein n=1 Tax=Littorina saxatilis TaxID=31220 RepID=UPI0038B5C31D